MKRYLTVLLLCLMLLTAAGPVSAEIVCTEHESVDYPVVFPTCTGSGYIGGTYCGICGAVLTPRTEVTAFGHNPVRIPSVPATETSTGLTEGIRCDVCGEVILAQKVIPMLSPAPTNTPVSTPVPTATDTPAETPTPVP
ncbi:MAG: hypothetical protein Q4G19_05375, partial [Clostridia bacterium]|nr:hypothetical protein [Clostridia bacterium]